MTPVHRRKPDNGHVSVITGPWSSERRSPGPISPIFFYIYETAMYACAFYGTRREWCSGQCSAGSAIHVDVSLTHATYVHIVGDQVHSFITMVFPGGSGLFRQDNASWHTAHIIQEWLEEHYEELCQCQVWLFLANCTHFKIAYQIKSSWNAKIATLYSCVPIYL